jgi:hypothetical protein
MDTVHAALVVKKFVLFYKLNEERMGFSDLLASNTSLNYATEAVHQFTKVSPVLPWKDSPEESRA